MLLSVDRFVDGVEEDAFDLLLAAIGRNQPSSYLRFGNMLNFSPRTCIDENVLPAPFVKRGWPHLGIAVCIDIWHRSFSEVLDRLVVRHNIRWGGQGS